MTNDEINIAVAELTGWHPHPENNKPEVKNKFWTFGGNGYGLNARETAAMPEINDFGFRPLPDYCNDLNMIDRAVRFLWHIDNFWYSYVSELESATGQDLALRTRTLLHATAKQRAVALLKACGKYKS